LRDTDQLRIKAKGPAVWDWECWIAFESKSLDGLVVKRGKRKRRGRREAFEGKRGLAGRELGRGWGVKVLVGRSLPYVRVLATAAVS
jgi:hypothetical protein